MIIFISSQRYLGRKLGENCVFPELLHVFESCSYRMIASKTSMLTKQGAEEVVHVYNVDEKRKQAFVSVTVSKLSFIFKRLFLYDV